MLKCGEEGRTEEYGVWGGTTEWDRPEAKALAEKLRKIERDNEILTLIRQGVTRDDIAERYQVAKRTVQRISAAARMQSTPDLIAA
jgi:DNA-binding NarL/FixJ family response regulator